MVAEEGAGRPSVPSRLFTADRGDAGTRLDLVLRRHLADLPAATRTRLQRWIVDGRVAVNGREVRRAAARVAAGDTISIVLPGLRARQRARPEAMDLRVLYEDNFCLIVCKPAGLVVHPSYRHISGTLLNGLLSRARQWPDGDRPSIVGRLDKWTSGLVLVARSPAAHAALQRALARADAEKVYLAVVTGRVTPPRGRIDLPLARDRRDRRRVIASPNGAPSLTHYRRLSTRDGVSLVRCELATGRMHQIRVHLAARGWPIVGDAVYGPFRGSAESAEAAPRQALHAWRLAFTHPVTGERIAAEAPLPADFAGLLTGAGLALS
jgi:23S rRNA pseudouridine1911/1915/1917 synthase